MKKTIFKGTATALITPFHNGKIDIHKFKELIDHQIENNIDAIVVCGTTGEAPTLDDAEHIVLIDTAVKHVKGKIPVIAGTGSNNTAHALYMSKKAYECGADALLSVTPYYNKCTQEGLYLHYEAIAKATPLPLILYNVPSRTSVNITPETVKRLFEIKNICAIKEASGNIAQCETVLTNCPDIALYSGNDDIIVPVMAIGGIGVISVLSNLIPGECRQIAHAFLNGNTEKAKNQQLKYLPLISALFTEPNPICIKKAMEIMGLCESETRLPLSPICKNNLDLLKNEMRKLNMI